MPKLALPVGIVLVLSVLIATGSEAWGARAEGSNPSCPALPGSSVLPKGLHLRLRLKTASVRAAGTVDWSINAVLTIRNEGPNRFVMSSGQPIVAAVVKPGTRTVVGTYSGPIAGTGADINLRSGQQRTIPVVVGTRVPSGTWRCARRRGSTLPPGTYGVRAGIPDGGSPRYLAPEVRLRITE